MRSIVWGSVVLAASLAGCAVTGITALGGADCNPGTVPSPDGKSCVSEKLQCTGFLTGKADFPTTCKARSPDGEGTLRVTFHTTGGSVLVKVRDGAGELIMDRIVPFPQEADLPLKGVAGTWGLEAMADASKASATFVLWG